MAEQPEIIKIRNNKGFTLVELAIVLVIVGMLVGVGSGMMGMLTTAIKVREAKDNVEAAVQSVTSWASANNRLPAATEFPSVTTSSKDSWGRDLIYLYDTNLNINPTKDTICGRRSTNLAIKTNDPAATINNVAYMVLSNGDDAIVEARLTGTLNGSPVSNAGFDKQGGTATGTIIVDPEKTPGKNDYYSNDIVRWVTLDELRTKIGCQGAPLKIVNNELPYGYKNTTYSATVFTDGGVPFSTGGNYKWCIKGSLPPGITNPTSGCSATSSCSALGTEGEWLQANTLVFPFPSTSPTAEGSYNFTVYVRDNNDGSPSTSIDNCASKPFVLTINP